MIPPAKIYRLILRKCDFAAVHFMFFVFGLLVVLLPELMGRDAEFSFEAANEIAGIAEACVVSDFGYGSV